MLLEMQLLDFLPACHDSSSTTEPDILPHLIDVVVVDGANVTRMGGKSAEFVAPKVVIVICHCIAEAADYGLGDV